MVKTNKCLVIMVTILVVAGFSLRFLKKRRLKPAATGFFEKLTNNQAPKIIGNIINQNKLGICDQNIAVQIPRKNTMIHIFIDHDYITQKNNQ